MSTNVVSIKDVRREKHVVDAKNQVLGRLAVEVANKLTGKSKVNYVPYLDMGDFVVVTNASRIRLTGKKTEQKKYYRHSGYPGGLKVESFEELIVRRPEEVIRHAVWGMVPKTKQGRQMIKRLKVYAGEMNKKSSVDSQQSTGMQEETNKSVSKEL